MRIWGEVITFKSRHFNILTTLNYNIGLINGVTVVEMVFLTQNNMRIWGEVIKVITLKILNYIYKKKVLF